MNAVSTLLLTIAATAGTLRAARSLREAIRRRRVRVENDRQDTGEGAVVDLVRDDATGVYGTPR